MHWRKPYKYGWFYWLKKYRGDKLLNGLGAVAIDRRWDREPTYDSY